MKLYSIKKIFMSCLFLILVLTSCTPEQVITPNDDLIEPEKLETLAERSIKSLTKKFLDDIMQNNYSNITDYIYLPPENFITKEDIIWYIPRSNVADLVDLKVDYSIDSIINDDTLGMESTSKFITINVTDRQFTINAVLDEKNEWKLHFPEMILSDWKFVIDADFAISINGIPVDDKFIDNIYTGNDAPSDNSIIYNIPAVSKREVEITLMKGVKKAALKVIPSDYIDIITYEFPEKSLTNKKD